MLGDNILADEEDGSWSVENLANTARMNSGIGADEGLPPFVRFRARVAKLVKRQISSSRLHDPDRRPAVFFLEPSARPKLQGSDPKRVPMLDNGLEPITGRLWFVNEAVVSGWYVEYGMLDDDSLFSVVTDHLGLGGVPAIVVDPRTTPPSVRYYATGLSVPDQVEVVEISELVGLSAVLAVVDVIHRKTLVTPEAQGKDAELWENGDKCWTSQHAERRVQLRLRVGLQTRFPTCDVREELPSPVGRFDLNIEEVDSQNPGTVLRHVVLELKVLRSHGSTGAAVAAKETIAWVKSGVEQASSYRDEWKIREAALCCFDMRQQPSGDKCFDHVRTLAKKVKVELRVWHIFGSSKRYREYLNSCQGPQKPGSVTQPDIKTQRKKKTK